MFRGQEKGPVQEELAPWLREALHKVGANNGDTQIIAPITCTIVHGSVMYGVNVPCISDDTAAGRGTDVLLIRTEAQEHSVTALRRMK